MHGVALIALLLAVWLTATSGQGGVLSKSVTIFFLLACIAGISQS